MFIETLNGIFFRLLYGKRLQNTIRQVFKSDTRNNIQFRLLEANDIKTLAEFFDKQPSNTFEYFKPHKFNLVSLQSLYKNPSFIMMGAYNRKGLIGYFFLRFFLNKTAFLGRIVDHEYQRKGIAKSMSHYLYSIIHLMNFRCLTSISKKNLPILNLHLKEESMRIVKEMADNYILVEIDCNNILDKENN